ncbi:hypothetical protein AU255_14720 [Methyloprofundus sedimenti]|uniref:Glycolate oxidase iron-sulfur subunit n=1 Tax=Methyloprofundus sedimenti TaxID=1420851 RepID=A0A1V8M1P0_9GAMM|nr:(Fe-S)-binding protein [Methyloprofundus sedimenti]OQK15479.1 hypothetical protein AU255_14720 [Methyloprofundus sedimenti]
MYELMDFDQSAGTYIPPSGPIIPDAMDCMRCGMCLSSCPTYQLTQDEQEGPRQRVRTLSRLLVGQETLSNEAVEHLQNCLQCRACEAVCPSKMDYGELFDQAQLQLASPETRHFYGRIALNLVAKKRWFKSVLPLVKFFQLSGLQALSRKLGILALIGLSRADNIAPVPTLKCLKPNYPVAEKRGVVALFSGCLSDHFDRQTLNDAIQVLNALGYEVLVPERQSCCGAMHLHNGEAENAKQLMRHNLKVFNALSMQAVIYCATGCGSQLQEYQHILANDEQELLAFQSKLQEVSEFINHNWPANLALEPCAKEVLVHEPCSQRNVLKNQSAVYAMLSRIPELDVRELAENNLCCGAAGSYMLTHPENADALRYLKWQQVESRGADYLVTSNIGCALQLKTVAQSNTRIEIIHPVSLLARQINRKI